MFDGHGADGDLCSKFASQILPKKIKSNKKYKTDFLSAYKESFLQTNHLLHKQKLNNKNSIDDSISGTTGICALFRGSDIYIANVGDSRCVGACRDQSTGKIKAVTLSVDQTPYRDDEIKRVKACGAEVLSVDQKEGVKDPTIEHWGVEEDHDGDPPRLWVKGEGYPGCAFTRSIGDCIAESIGVVSEPEIVKRSLTPDDAYIIICSDGVFEFLTSQQVVDIASAYPEPVQACHALLMESYNLWLHFDVRSDDITAIVMQLSSIPNNTNTNSENNSNSNNNNKSSTATVNNVVKQKNRPVRNKMNQKAEKMMGKMSELSEEELQFVLPDQFNGSEEEKANLFKCLKNHFLFRQLDEKSLHAVTDALLKIEVEKDDTIINQGEVGDNFFIVYEGYFDVYIVREGDVMEKVHTYQAMRGIYPSFGELALLYDKPRCATVTAQSDGVLFALDRQSFRSTVLRNNGLEALRNLPFLTGLSIEQLKDILNNSKEQSYLKDEVIYDCSIESDYFFVLISGSVRYKDVNDVDVILTPYALFGKQTSNNKVNQTFIANSEIKCLQINDNQYDFVQHCINNMALDASENEDSVN